jgi:hypothetical protein
MTIPLDMTVVCFTLEQIGEEADVAVGVEPPADDVPPDMFIPGTEPPVDVDDDVDDAALFVTLCEEASASETAASTSIAAVAIDAAPVHHALPANPSAPHRRLTRCLRSPMPPPCSWLQRQHHAHVCVDDQAGVRRL